MGKIFRILKPLRSTNQAPEQKGAAAYFHKVNKTKLLLIIFPDVMSSIMVIRALGSLATSTILFGYFSLVY
jgi:hypothetical protein